MPIKDNCIGLYKIGLCTPARRRGWEGRRVLRFCPRSDRRGPDDPAQSRRPPAHMWTGPGVRRGQTDCWGRSPRGGPRPHPQNSGGLWGLAEEGVHTQQGSVGILSQREPASFAAWPSAPPPLNTQGWVLGSFDPLGGEPSTHTAPT